MKSSKLNPRAEVFHPETEEKKEEKKEEVKGARKEYLPIGAEYVSLNISLEIILKLRGFQQDQIESLISTIAEMIEAGGDFLLKGPVNIFIICLLNRRAFPLRLIDLDSEVSYPTKKESAIQAAASGIFVFSEKNIDKSYIFAKSKTYSQNPWPLPIECVFHDHAYCSEDPFDWGRLRLRVLKDGVIVCPNEFIDLFNAISSQLEHHFFGIDCHLFAEGKQIEGMFNRYVKYHAQIGKTHRFPPDFCFEVWKSYCKNQSKQALQKEMAIFFKSDFSKNWGEYFYLIRLVFVELLNKDISYTRLKQHSTKDTFMEARVQRICKKLIQHSSKSVRELEEKIGEILTALNERTVSAIESSRRGFYGKGASSVPVTSVSSSSSSSKPSIS